MAIWGTLVIMNVPIVEQGPRIREQAPRIPRSATLVVGAYDVGYLQRRLGDERIETRGAAHRFVP